MESEGSLIGYTQVHPRNEYQTEQLLLPDTGNQDSPPSCEERSIECQSMPGPNQSNIASDFPHVCQSNHGFSSHCTVRDGVPGCHSCTVDNSTPNQGGHDAINSTIYGSTNDAVMSCIADSDIDFNSIVNDRNFPIVYVQEDIPCQQDVHGRNFTNQHVGYAEEQIVYMQEGDINEQVVYIQDGAFNEQVLRAPDVLLNGDDLFQCQSMPDLNQSNIATDGLQVCESKHGFSSHCTVRDGDSDVLGCHSYTVDNSTPNQGGYDAINSTIYGSTNDAAMSCIADSDIDFNSIVYDSDFPIVYVQEDIPYQQAVHGQGVVNQRVGCAEEQIVYMQEGDINGQVVYIQDRAFNEQAVRAPGVWLNGDDLFQQQPIVEDDDVDLENTETDIESDFELTDSNDNSDFELSDSNDNSDFELSYEARALFAHKE